MQNNTEIDSLIKQLNNIGDLNSYNVEEIRETINILGELLELNCTSDDISKIKLVNLCSKINDINNNDKNIENAQTSIIMSFLINLCRKVDDGLVNLSINQLVGAMTGLQNLKIDNIIILFAILKDYDYFQEDLYDLNFKNIIKQINKFGTTDMIGYYTISEVINLLYNLFYSKNILKALDLDNLIGHINKIENFDTETISDILLGLVGLGYTKKDLKTLDINRLLKQAFSIEKEQILYLIPTLVDLGYKKNDFEEIYLIDLVDKVNKCDNDKIFENLYSLVKLNYQKKDLEELNLKVLIDKINSNDKDILVYIVPQLLNLGYTKDEFKEIDLDCWLEEVNKIKNNDSEKILFTFSALAILKFKKNDLKESLKIESLLKQLNKPKNLILKHEDIFNILFVLENIDFKIEDLKKLNLNNLVKQIQNFKNHPAAAELDEILHNNSKNSNSFLKV